MIAGPCLLVLVFGYTSSVRAPESVEDPVVIHFIQNANHRGIWFPREEGGFVEFGYGDWDWFATNKDSWYHVFDTVLWPTRGAVGRRVSNAKDWSALMKEYPTMTFNKLAVERQVMRILLEQTEDLFVGQKASQHWNARYRMSFIPTDEGYWFSNNCNDKAAEWLEELGCEVSWVPIRIDLEVE